MAEDDGEWEEKPVAIVRRGVHVLPGSRQLVFRACSMCTDVSRTAEGESLGKIPKLPDISRLGILLQRLDDVSVQFWDRASHTSERVLKMIVDQQSKILLPIP